MALPRIEWVDYRMEHVRQRAAYTYIGYPFRARTVLRLLERLDAFQKLERITAFIIACEADARGRPGLEKRDYPQALHLHEYFAATHAISAQEIVARGVSGTLVGEMLHEARVQAVRAMKSRWLNQGANQSPV